MVVSDVSIHEAIQLSKYPIQDLSNRQTQLEIQRCKRDLAQNGVCELAGFITATGIHSLTAECASLEPQAFFKAVEGNAYLEEVDLRTPEDSPKRMTEPTRVGVIAYDQFPKESLLRRIYEYEPLMKFIGAVLELAEIYRYADPLGALNLAVMKKGDYLRWHFDQTDFVTSLAIQSSESGGAFEYAPMIRNEKEENYDAVKSLLMGDRKRVRSIPAEPGTLVLFKGRYSIHRVTRIEGSRSRWMALFAYDSKPGVVSSDHLRQMRYGRTQPFETSIS